MKNYLWVIIVCLVFDFVTYFRHNTKFTKADEKRLDKTLNSKLYKYLNNKHLNSQEPKDNETIKKNIKKIYSVDKRYEKRSWIILVISSNISMFISVYLSSNYGYSKFKYSFFIIFAVLYFICYLIDLKFFGNKSYKNEDKVEFEEEEDNEFEIH